MEKQFNSSATLIKNTEVSMNDLTPFKLVRKSKLVNGKYCGLDEDLQQNQWEYIQG